MYSTVLESTGNGKLLGVSAFVASLKACAKQKDLSNGSQIHAAILKTGLLAKSIHISNTLINMYAKCGALTLANEVFDEFHVRGVVSWNALITGCVKYSQDWEALMYFEHMQHEGVYPDAITFSCIMKACAVIGAVNLGKEIHIELAKRGYLKEDTFIGSSLVDMYAKCNDLLKAQEVFDEIRVRDAVLWNVLIAGYAQHGHNEEAVACFEQVPHEGLAPDAVTIIAILKACGNIRAVDKGKQIHAETVQKGLLKEVVVGTAMLEMYVKCDLLEKAEELFNELPYRDIVSWNVLILGYIEHGNADLALNLLEQMQYEGFFPDVVTFIGILRVCASLCLFDMGIETHAAVASKGLLKKSAALGTALVEMYVKCDALQKAQEVFDEYQVMSVDSWNALTSGYAQHECGNEVLKCYEQMQLEGLSPDASTLVSALKACGIVGSADVGMEIHGEIIKQGLLESNIVIGTALVVMYAKCGAFDIAEDLLYKLQVWDIIAWNALIAGFVQNGLWEDALSCFEDLQLEGLSPNMVTIMCILKACCITEADQKVKELHMFISKDPLLSKNIFIGTALIDAYVKTGALEKALEVFENFEVRDLVAWNAVIAGYVQYGQHEEAIACFECMQLDGFTPSVVTMVCILQACGSIGAADKGKEVHSEIVRVRLLEGDTFDLIALVDMYAKCGVLEKAQDVFDEIKVRNVDAWTILITAYAHHGNGVEVLRCFERMQHEGVLPDAVTFTVVLNACSHAGLLEEGEAQYCIMSTFHNIVPTMELFNCMVDLFGRAGQLIKAIGWLEKMAIIDYLPLWNALMGACQKWENAMLGRLAFDYVIQLDARDPTAYVCMSNIYIAASMDVEACEIEAMRLKNKARKFMVD